MDVSEQEHECDAFDGSFLDVSSQETVDDNHNQKQPDVFQCSICDMKYAHKSSLKRHMNKHSNEPSFTCGICHQYFNNCHIEQSTMAIAIYAMIAEKNFKTK
jgi:transcription elongation factor Elf1